MTRKRALPPSLKWSLVNGLIFQLVWLACVAGGASGLWWLGPAAVLAFAMWHIPRTSSPRAELSLAVIAAVAGLAIDTALLRFGLLSYPEHGPFALVAPVWIVALWAGFALTLNHSLAWLRDRPVLSTILGGVSGPFSYWIGARAWGAVDFAAPTPLVLAVLAAIWAAAVPALFIIAGRLSSPSISLRRHANGRALAPAIATRTEDTSPYRRPQ